MRGAFWHLCDKWGLASKASLPNTSLAPSNYTAKGGRAGALVNPLSSAAQQPFILVERFSFQSLFLPLHYKGKSPPETLPYLAPVSVWLKQPGQRSTEVKGHCKLNVAADSPCASPWCHKDKWHYLISQGSSSSSGFPFLSLQTSVNELQLHLQESESWVNEAILQSACVPW